MNRIFFILFLLFSGQMLKAQGNATPMSLKDCVGHATRESTVVRKAALEAQQTEYQIREMKAQGLPQVNLTTDVLYNFARPVEIAPGELFEVAGRDVPIRFGKNIQTGIGLEVKQALFLPGASAGRTGQAMLGELNDLRLQKSREDVALEVAKTYFQALIVMEKRGLLEANMNRIEGLLRLTEKQFQNGFAMEVDVKRLRVALRNLQTNLTNLELQQDQLLQLLKYKMAMPLDSAIVLRDSLTEKPFDFPESASAFNLNDRTEISLLQLRNELNQIQIERLEAGKFPSLYAVGRLNLLAWGDNPGEWASTDYWYGDSFLGLRLEYPIFDGHRRRAKMEQAAIGAQLDQTTLLFTEQSLQLQFNAALQKLRVNANELQSLLENRELAEEIYDLTQKRYTEGVAPIMELLSAEVSMREAQTNYLTALLEAQLAELELWAARGELMEKVME